VAVRGSTGAGVNVATGALATGPGGVACRTGATGTVVKTAESETITRERRARAPKSPCRVINDLRPSPSWVFCPN